MTEGVWVAIIAAVQGVVLALIGKVARDSSITRKEVKNSHATNLREELDDRHHEQMAELRGIRKDVGRLDERDIERGREVRRIDAKVDSLGGKLGEHLEWSREYVQGQESQHRDVADRIGDIETTLNPKENL